MSKNASGASSAERSYAFAYDGLQQLASATYQEKQTGNTTFSSNLHGFDETITYESSNSGNITGLVRNSSTQNTNSNVQIDNLVYTYDSSHPYQLQKVTDGTDANHTGAGFRNLTNNTTFSYSYDSNGNIKIDPNKGLTLTYNVLNKTDSIKMSIGTNRWIDYTYDAGGNVLRKRQWDNNTLVHTTDYIGGFVYLDGTLQYFPMTDGRVLNTGTASAPVFTQEFIFTDQQGNARVSFQNNGSGAAIVKQENSYYPSGLIMPNSPVATPTIPNKQLYNGGAEWQNDFANSPDYYQTFNRNYDAALMRFIAVDPIAESAESMTSYQYAGNNPVSNNDPLGSKILNNPIDYPDYYKPLGGAGGGGPGHISAVEDGFGSGLDDENAFMGSVLSGTYFSSSNTGGDYSAFWNGFAASNLSFDNYKAKYDAATDNGTKTSDIFVDKDGNVDITAGGKHTNWVDTQDDDGNWHHVGTEANQGGTGPGVRPSNDWFLAHGWKSAPWYGNFLGPGPDGPKFNPYKLIGPNGKVLKPIDMVDAAAQRHDYSYWQLQASGVQGALFDREVWLADLALARSAAEVMDRWVLGQNDTITGKPISNAEAAWAEGVTLLFGGLGSAKLGTYTH